MAEVDKRVSTAHSRSQQLAASVGLSERAPPLRTLAALPRSCRPPPPRTSQAASLAHRQLG
eukprot:10218272-Alexandrium_andersonii.AAC.1